MASTLLPPGATLEAYAHCCTASEAREHLTRTPREWLRTHGHIAVARAMEFNKDPVGVTRVLLEQPEIQVNLREFGEEMYTLLLLALSMHDEDENEENRKSLVSLILKRPDLDPNVGNSKGDTPLLSAVRASSEPCVAILLQDRRVNIAAVNYDKQTSLHVACEARSTETSDQIARMIIDSARPTVRNFSQFLGKQDRLGNTGLHYAAARGRESVADAFFEPERLGNKHELVLKKNHQGNLAINWAAKNGHLGVVKRMLVDVDFIFKIKDQDGFRLLHDAVRSGSQEILEVFIQLLPKPMFNHYEELLALTLDKNMADFLLQRLNKEIVKNPEGKEDDYLAKFLQLAVQKNSKTLVEAILKWYPKKAMYEAQKWKNETIQAVLKELPEVQRDFKKMHKKYTYYVTAANAILVVSVLIIQLTFGHCFTAVEAAQRRKDISELKEFGGPPDSEKVHGSDFILLPRWAFFQAMMATILAAFASLPFSFAFFFHEAVDDTKVRDYNAQTSLFYIGPFQVALHFIHI